jgi:hypothetical protein
MTLRRAERAIDVVSWKACEPPEACQAGTSLFSCIESLRFKTTKRAEIQGKKPE